MNTDNSRILFDVASNGIATITLNRPDCHNAFNPAMVKTITQHINTCSHESRIRLLIIRSTGRTFSSGADLHWMQESIHYSTTQNEADAKDLALMMHTLATFKKPSLAIVQGSAYGGAIGLIACCHIAIVAKHATFCFSEVTLGIIPAVIGPYIIRAIGARQALAYFVSAQPFDATTALRIGLCHAVASSETLEDTAQRWIATLHAGGPLAQQAVSHFVDRFVTPLSDDLIAQTAHLIATLRVSEEGQTGLRAFLAKQKPRWSM